MTADEPGERLFLFGEIPAPPPDREEAFMKAALEANFFGRETGGAVFSLNPANGAYTLVQSERLDSLDPKSFFSLIEKFVNTLATWNGISAATSDPRNGPIGEPEPTARPDDAQANFDAGSSPFNFNFIRG